MQRFLLALSVLVLLASCGQPAPPPDNGEPPGGGTGTLDCGPLGRDHSEISAARPIEFGTAYRVTSGRTYLRATMATPGTVRLQVNTIPPEGIFQAQIIAADHIAIAGVTYGSDVDVIPPSTTLDAEVDYSGLVFVRITSIPDLQNPVCADMEIVLTRD